MTWRILTPTVSEGFYDLHFNGSITGFVLLALNFFSPEQIKAVIGFSDSVPHHESVLHTDDVAAQHGGLDLGHADGFALPGVAHARNDVVAADGRQLLAEDLGAAVGLVGVLGDDGRLGHHDARARVLELGVDVDVLALAEAAPVDLGIEGHLAVGDEHAGDLLLLHAAGGRLQEKTEVRIRMTFEWWMDAAMHTLLVNLFLAQV